ncbi:hypothetical protein ACFOWU_09545 [Epilithonimonas zeae]|uniref:Uncharacterized protein n=1 Tax=Epilithonimonas zeae TaxID=1416779 RepID=A0A1N6GQR3_9FLAO|nr:hypothetical protein [Epilithonimonas zeae]SIO09858.1 hypothetical protein SAMN05444409_1992 [Epilithonimonas zeae]
MEKQHESESLHQFIQVIDGAICHNIYAGYIKILKNTHPSRSISVQLRVTSDPPNDDVTGQRISYLMNPIIVGANSSSEIGCDVPGPTRQRFFFVPEIVKWGN